MDKRKDQDPCAAEQDWTLLLVGILIALTIAWGIGFFQGRDVPERRVVAKAYAKTLYQNAQFFEDKGCMAGVDMRLSDLCAQWKASDAAASNARAAWWQVILGGGTLLAAVAAALFAKNANLEAKRSASAAEDALTEAKNSAELQLRPWIVFDAKLEKSVNFEAYVDGSWDLWFRILAETKNVGSTPAVAVNLSVHVFDTLTAVNSIIEAKRFYDEIVNSKPPLERLGGLSVAPGEIIGIKASFGKNGDDLITSQCSSREISLNAAVIVTYRSFSDPTKLYHCSKLYQIAEFFDHREGKLATCTNVRELSFKAANMEMLPLPSWQEVV